MAWDIELAKEFKNRDNIIPSGAQLGEVINVDSLKVSIMQNNIILEKNNIYVCSNLIKDYIRKADIKLNTVAEHGVITTEGTITYKDILQKGDKVLCVPTENGQKYFIIDKVVL